jgi:hypothetical protein
MTSLLDFSRNYGVWVVAIEPKSRCMLRVAVSGGPAYACSFSTDRARSIC